MIRRFLVATISAAALGAPVAAYATRPAVYRGLILSTSDATITPVKCTATMRAAVYYTDPDRLGPPPGSGIQVTGSQVTGGPAGAAVDLVSSAASWRNGVSSVTYALRLCGFGASYPETATGWYRVAVRLGTGAEPKPRAGFTVRYQGKVSFNATPEPVRRGAYVTLTASVTDGWEYFDSHPIRFYFRRTHSTAWRYLGSATPRCIEMCDEGDTVYQATRRVRQTVSGTWTAVSQRTAYLAAGRRSDTVHIA